MARIDALPSLEIIRGLKGILDFYVWKGLPCVRAWPKYRPAKQTAPSLAAALVFGAIVKSYGLLHHLPLEAYRHDAKDQTRTARDIMVTGVYGNLHEASMSDFLDLLQESRDFLSDLTALLEALHSIDTDQLVVRTQHSVLPDGASTAAAQALALAAMLTRATSPLVYNVTMTLADTEYSQALPANTKKFLVRCRGHHPIKVCSLPLGSGTLFVTVPSAATYWEDLIQITGLTLYFQCPTAAQVCEIIAWS